MKTIKGLTQQEVLASRQKNGWNELPGSKEKSLWLIVWAVVKEPMFLLLITCAALYMTLGDLKQGIILMLQVLVVIGITFYQERKTEKALSAIRDLSSPRAFVVRNGENLRIAGKEVVLGDVIVLQEGDRIPADAKVLSEVNISINESLLTGESAPVSKKVWEEGMKEGTIGGEENAFVYSGTLIVQGRGYAEIIATGIQTQIGKIGKSLETVEEEKTLLQAEIRQLVKVFSILGGIVFVVAIVSFGLLRGEWLQGLLAALAVAMAMLPEEFPVVLTIFMALGAWRMSQKNVLARRVATIETLGSATVLCTDKTGTITQNKMQVEQIYANEQSWNVGKDSKTEFPEHFHELIEYALLAGQIEPFDPMEKALLILGTEKLAKTEHLHPNWKLEKEYALSKDLLAMSRVFSQKDAKGYVVAAKGAPEAILKLCHVDEAAQKPLLEVVTNAAKEGLRILGVAKSTLNKDSYSTKFPETQDKFSFTFLGFVAMSDPIRKEVPKAIKECYTAGMRVIMITGDYAATAQHIGREIGLKNHEQILAGEEMSKLSDKELQKASKKINIFYRVAPEQKLRLVNALKANGEIVAMTGDGVNDAPALKAAHIGIAMGGKGTDVARETASLVLLDDNFASIVSAIKMGRRIFDNLQKAMMYIFAIHIPIIALSIVPMLTSFLPLMLLPIHIAFMELVIDPACSIVFEAEEAEKDIMKRPPRHINDRFFSFRKIRLGVFQGISLTIAVFAVLGWGWFHQFDEKTLRGMAFTTILIGNLCLILTNLSHHISIFSTLTTLKNSTVKWMVLGVLALVFMSIYVPFVADLFKVQQLSWINILIAIGAGIISIAWFELMKIFHLGKKL